MKRIYGGWKRFIARCCRAFVRLPAGRARLVVLKLHPFESARQRLRLVNRILNEDDRKLVSVTDAPLSREILQKTWCAVTVESTVAFECASVGIPAFLCGWLRHAYAGYAPQYVRFGVGRMLEFPDDLLRIPDMLRAAIPGSDTARRLVQAISPEALSEVLCQPRRAVRSCFGISVQVATKRVTTRIFMITIFTPSFADEANTNAQNLTVKEIVSRLPADRFRVVMLGTGPPDPRILARENTEILPWSRHGNTARWLTRVLLSKIDVYFFPREGPLDTLFLFCRRSLGLPVALVTYVVMALDEIDVGPTTTRSIRHADCVVGNSRYVTQTVKDRFGVAATTIYDGMRRDWFYPPPEARRPGSKPTVLYAGSLQARKRANVVIREAANWPAVEFRLAGKGEEEENCRVAGERIGMPQCDFYRTSFAAAEWPRKCARRTCFFFPAC